MGLRDAEYERLIARSVMDGGKSMKSSPFSIAGASEAESAWVIAKVRSVRGSNPNDSVGHESRDIDVREVEGRNSSASRGE